MKNELNEEPVFENFVQNCVKKLEEEFFFCKKYGWNSGGKGENLLDWSLTKKTQLVIINGYVTTNCMEKVEISKW